MKTAIIILALTATAHAQVSERPGNGRGRGTSNDTTSSDTSDWTRDNTWSTDCDSHSVPEPSSPLAMLVSAAMALVTRRKRGRGKWVREKRIDLRTVRIF